MEPDKININIVKQNLLKIPKTRLAELNDFIESILRKTDSFQSKRVEKLEGIWKNLGFEKIPDLNKSIREIRNESEDLMVERIKSCNI
jgi:hypothetical protein